MTAEWERVPIEKVYLGLYDGPHATPKPASDGPVFLGIKNITEDGKLDLTELRHIAEEDFPRWTRRVTPQAGDIVFSYEATLNLYTIIPRGFRGCLGRRLALIRPNANEIDPRFLFYFFFSDEWRRVVANNLVIGATVDRIPLIRFPEFKVARPPRPIQRKIAAILSAYDDLIENDQRRIRLLEEMAATVYREWFVHFRFPEHEAVPMVDGVPEGWEKKELGDIAQENRRGVNPSDIISVWSICRANQLHFLNGELQTKLRAQSSNFSSTRYCSARFVPTFIKSASRLLMESAHLTQSLFQPKRPNISQSPSAVSQVMSL